MKSTLEVKGLTAYFYSLGYFLIIIFSLTFAFPWAFSRYHSWLINNTKINGKRLIFDGKTKHLYLIYLSGLIYAVIFTLIFSFIYTLIIIILKKNGIDTTKAYELYLKVWGTFPTLLFAICITTRFYKYRSKHTHFIDYDNTKSGLKLKLANIVLSSIIFKVIVVLTSFIGYPFALNIRERFLQSRRYIDGDDLKFKGSIGKICGIWYLGLLLSLLTLSFYIPYLFFKLNRYIITNTILKDNECLE